MATFTDRVQVVVDFVTDGAKKGLSSLRADVAAADTTMGKAKAAASNLGAQVGPYMGAAAMAGGAALVSFGVKSVKAFTDTALAAGDFADAAAVSVEDASKWIALGDDYSISADTIQGALTKVNKASDGVFEKYGIDVVRAADGTRDANATFLAALDAVGKMPDANERAKAATELFGKSYAEVSRLIEMGAKDIQAALDDVSDSQIITDEERDKAREFQASMDALSDTFGDFALNVGQTLTPAISGATDALTAFLKVADLVSSKGEADGKSGIFDSWSQIWEDAKWHFENIKTGGNAARLTLDNTAKAVAKLAEEHKRGLHPSAEQIAEDLKDGADRAEYYASRVESAGEESGAAAKSIDAAARSADGIRKAADDAAQAVADFYNELRGDIDAEQQLADIAEGFTDLQASEDAVWVAAAEGPEAAAEAMAEYEQKQRDLKLEVIDYAEAVGDVPEEVVTDILADIDEGNLAEAQRKLDSLEETRHVPVVIDVTGDVWVDENGNVHTTGRSAGRSAGASNGLASSAGAATPGGARALPGAGSADWERLVAESQKSQRTVEDIWSQWEAQRLASEEDMFRARHEMGEVDEATWREYLAGKLASTEKYSDEYMKYWRELQSFDEEAARKAEQEAEAQRQAAEEEAKAREEAAREEARIMEAKYALGKIDRDTYLAFLQEKQNGTERWSAEWVALEEEMRRLRKEARDEERAARQKEKDEARDARQAEREAAREAREAEQEAEDRAEERAARREQTIRERQDNRYAAGRMSTDKYLALLRERLAGEEQFSDEWMAIKQQIDGLEDEQEQSEIDRIDRQEQREDNAAARARARGEMTLEDYKAYIRERIQATEEGTDEYERLMAIWEDLREEEADATQSAIDLAYAEAEARRELADAVDDEGEAKSGFLEVLQEYADGEATGEDVKRAAEAYAQAIYNRILLKVNKVAADDRVRWARLMRRRLTTMRNRMTGQFKPIADALDRLLLGIPDFDEEAANPDADTNDNSSSDQSAGVQSDSAGTSGQSLNATPPGRSGGTPVNVTIHAGLGTDPVQLGKAVTDALQQYARISGPLDLQVR